MKIRIIIEHKYYSSYQKQICNYREERREVWYLFLQIKRKTPNFKNPIQD